MNRANNRRFTAMTLGVVGKKLGTTRIFTEAGDSIPVTVLFVDPNRVVQVKNVATDGYRALQITTGHVSARKLSKPLIGHYAKAGVEAGSALVEFVLDDAEEGSDLVVGSEIKVDMFVVGQKVDVTGTTKGKGFAGAIKRHHFRSQDATHGNSVSHRAPGSIGQRQTPGRVFKGKKMAGHLGNVQRTVQSQKIARIDVERNLLLITGAVPGAPGGRVIIKPAAKVRGDRNGA